MFNIKDILIYFTNFSPLATLSASFPVRHSSLPKWSWMQKGRYACFNRSYKHDSRPSQKSKVVLFESRHIISSTRLWLSRLLRGCPPSKCNNEISAQAYCTVKCEETQFCQRGSATPINIYFIPRSAVHQGLKQRIYILERWIVAYTLSGWQSFARTITCTSCECCT